jgi:hypothetical protein
VGQILVQPVLEYLRRVLERLAQGQGRDVFQHLNDGVYPGSNGFRDLYSSSRVPIVTVCE